MVPDNRDGDRARPVATDELVMLIDAAASYDETAYLTRNRQLADLVRNGRLLTNASANCAGERP